MSPDPNNPDDKTVDINASMVINNIVMPIDDEQNFSSEESDNETEYNAYKLLAQDDIPNGDMDDSDDDDDDDNDDDGDNIDAKDHNDIPNFGDFENINMSSNEENPSGINYQNLYCEGVDDDLVPSSLGIRESSLESDFIQCDTTEDNEHIDMCETQVELVRSAMVGFSLPPINIPEWAKNISEDDWKETLINTIQKNTDT